MSGARPGEITAAACSVPCAEATSTTSPSASPSFAAVAGFTSTQVLHIADVNGSGISWSHGRWASDPSRKVDDEYGRKWKGNCCESPSNWGSVKPTAWGRAPPAAAGPGAVAGRASAGGIVPHQPPRSWASLHASPPSAEGGNAANDAPSISSKDAQGHSSGRWSFPLISISMSAVARVACSGRITGGATLATAVGEPDSGTASVHDSRY